MSAHNQNALCILLPQLEVILTKQLFLVCLGNTFDWERELLREEEEMEGEEKDDNDLSKVKPIGRGF